MVTSRSLRAEKRTAAKALGGSVLTNKVRFSTLVTSEQQATPAMRELVYSKNRLQHQVVNLQDLTTNQAATIVELTINKDLLTNNNEEFVLEHKRLSDENLVLLDEQQDLEAQLVLAREQIVKYKDLLHAVEPQYSGTHNNDDNSTTVKVNIAALNRLKTAAHTLIRDNERLASMYAKVINEQKQLFKAANTAGTLLANAVRPLRPNM